MKFGEETEGFGKGTPIAQARAVANTQQAQQSFIKGETEIWGVP